MMPKPILILTRPAHSARRFAALCEARFGSAVRIVLCPLMQIEYLTPDCDPAAFDHIIFTSENGAMACHDRWPDLRLSGYAVGDRTAQAGAALGYDLKPAQGDADSLVALIQRDAPSGRLLHLRGATARGDIADRLTQSGLPTQAAILYRQVAVPPRPEVMDLLCGEIPLLVPLFSPLSATIFQGIAKSAQAPLYLAAISRNAADALNEMTAPCVVAAKPNAEEMLNVISTLVDQAALGDDK